MVGSGAAAFEQTHAPRGIGSGGSDGGFEIGPGDMVRTGAGDQQAAGTNHFERTQIQFLVAAQGAFDGAPGFGEGGRIEDDGVKTLARLRPVAENFEGVGLDPVDFGGDAGAIGFEIALGDFERGTRGVDAA